MSGTVGFECSTARQEALRAGGTHMGAKNSSTVNGIASKCVRDCKDEAIKLQEGCNLC